jgi:hypothetical protein
MPYLQTALMVRGKRLIRGATTMLVVLPAVGSAQTDWFNTDRGRPLHVQDARAIERYAFELQVAPVHWSRGRSGRDVWTVEPEIAYGILPRTQLGVGVAVSHVPAINGLRQLSATSLHVSALHALNVETLSIPALALSAELEVPFGSSSSRRVFPMLGLAATRTTSLGRLHANADLGLAAEEPASPDACGPEEPLAPHDESRWLVGVALDRAFALKSMLLAAELVARQPVISGSEVEWRAAGGIRWQRDPNWSLNAGLGRSFGDAKEWSVTFGAARTFGLYRVAAGGPR